MIKIVIYTCTTSTGYQWLKYNKYLIKIMISIALRITCPLYVTEHTHAHTKSNYGFKLYDGNVLVVGLLTINLNLIVKFWNNYLIVNFD